MPYRGSRDEQLTEEQKLRGSIWSQRNLYRDVIEPARKAAASPSRSTTLATRSCHAHGRRGAFAEVAAYSGHSVGELAAVAAGDPRLRSQTTLAVYTHATGQASELALEAVDEYRAELLVTAPRLRAALAS